jgi:hypothetical protein
MGRKENLKRLAAVRHSFAKIAAEVVGQLVMIPVAIDSKRSGHYSPDFSH